MSEVGAEDRAIERARQAGSTTLVFTVDLAVTGKRFRDDRNAMLGGGVRGGLSKAVQLPIPRLDLE